MCTAITVQSPGGSTWFGRTLDFSYPLSPGLYQVPKNYRWSNLCGTHTIQNRYGFLGIGQDIHPLVFADGVNEVGFAAAALYFPGHASYDPAEPASSSALSIAATELVSFLLGQCGAVRQAAGILHSIRIVGIEDSVTKTIAPLHWILTDKSGECLVVEKTADGLHLWNNAIGTLTNSPDFPWHMTNLRNYTELSPNQTEDVSWLSTALSPFGQAAGTSGLPGGYTPPARFVRTSYLKSHTDIPAEKEKVPAVCFHLLESVMIPKGPIITARGTADYTQYTAVIDLSSQEYFIRNYDSLQVLRNTADWRSSSGGKLSNVVTI